MRDYLLSVLELVKPYRFRFVVGLAAGFLSGILAFTLPVSLSLAVQTIFPGDTAAAKLSPGKSKGMAAAPSAGSNTNLATVEQSARKNKRSRGLRGSLEAAQDWFAPPERPSKARMLLVICLIPGAMLLRGLLGYLNIYLLSWVSIHA